MVLVDGAVGTSGAIFGLVGRCIVSVKKGLTRTKYRVSKLRWGSIALYALLVNINEGSNLYEFFHNEFSLCLVT